jgi:hypothetical protein
MYSGGTYCCWCMSAGAVRLRDHAACQTVLCAQAIMWSQASAGMQYAASVHAEKLKKVLHHAANKDRLAGQTIGKQYFNPRLVPGEVSNLTMCSCCAAVYRPSVGESTTLLVRQMAMTYCLPAGVRPAHRFSAQRSVANRIGNRSSHCYVRPRGGAAAAGVLAGGRRGRPEVS